MNNKIASILSKNQFTAMAFQHEFWSAIYRRSLLVEHQIAFPLLTNGEDIVFLLNVLIKKPTISICNDVSYFYFQRDVSASSNRSFACQYSVAKHFELQLELLNSADLSQEDYIDYYYQNILSKLVEVWYRPTMSKVLNKHQCLKVLQSVQFIYKRCRYLDLLHQKYAAPYYKALNEAQFLKDTDVDLFNSYLMLMTTKIFFLGIILLLSIENKQNYKVYKLFGFIPFFKVRRKEK